MSQIQNSASPRGMLKIASTIIGVVAVALVSAGYDKSPLSRNFVRDLRKCEADFMHCPQYWASELGMSIVIISWIFSILTLVAFWTPFYKDNYYFETLDKYGHLVFAILLLLASGLIAFWVANCFLIVEEFFPNPDRFGKSSAEIVLMYFSVIYWLLGSILTMIQAVLFFFVFSVCHNEVNRLQIL